MDEGDIAEAWRAAAKVYERLEDEEKGLAEHSKVLPLPAEIHAHVDKLVELPQFQNVFGIVPITFGMVELDRLVASQFEVRVPTVDALTRSIEKPVSNEAMARICLPVQEPAADFTIGKVGGSEYVFHSNTHDMRFLGAQVLDHSAIHDPAHRPRGFIKAVVALTVGYSTNVLNAVRYKDRLVLNNGYHRAYTLRSLGVTHVPCVIQVCAHREEVAIAASLEIVNNFNLYFGAERPPMLKDYFNPELTRRYVTRSVRRQIGLSFETTSADITQ